MKKLLALIISLTLVLSCLPGAAMAEKYKSNLLNKTIKLPGKMALVDEQQMNDGSVQLIISIETQPDAAIYTTVQMVEGFNGYTMSTLPDEQLDAWTEYYYQYYPENASAGRLPSNSGNGDSLYYYCGQNEDGGSILVYASVKGELSVSSYCVAAGGFSKATMQGTLEALNAVNAAFGKSVSGSTVYDYVFDHDDYDVVVVFLLLDDDDIDLYEDDDFDWDDEDWDEDDEDDDDDDADDNDAEDDNDDGNDDNGDWDSEDDADDDDSGFEDGGDEDYSGYEDSGDEDYSGYEDGGDEE